MKIISNQTFRKDKKLANSKKVTYSIILFLILTFNAKSQIRTEDEISRTIVSEKQIGEVPDWKKMMEKNPEIKKPCSFFHYTCFTNDDISKIKVIGALCNGAECVNFYDQFCQLPVTIQYIEKKDTTKNHIRFGLPSSIKEFRGINFSTGNVCDYKTASERNPSTQSGGIAGIVMGVGEMICHYTSIYPVIDGNLKGRNSIAGPFVISPDMNHLAYIGIGSGNAKYEGLTNITFSDTAKAFVYYDDVRSREYEYVRASSLQFSPDGKHLMYAAQVKTNEWALVLDGKEQLVHGKVGEILFSPDGEHFAYSLQYKDKWRIVCDGKESKDYNLIYGLTFSPDGQHFVYGASVNKGKWLAVYDGKESEEYSNLGYFNFSSDSKHIYYIVINPKNVYLVLDGQAQNKGMYKDIYPSTVKFSPDCSKIAYCAKKGSKWVMVIDGEEQIENGGSPSVSYFGPDNKTVFYIGSSLSGWNYFVNNQKLGKIPATNTTDVIFSNNGAFYAYISGKRVFINGNKGQEYNKVLNLKFISDNEISYLAEKNGKINQIIEKLE
jgi:hypothetical protein